jgi:PAS domain S-box-containing protein
MTRAQHASALAPNALPLDTTRAAHFEALVDSSEDAILSKDREAVITSWNPAAERLYGYRAEEAIGRPIRILIPKDHANEEMVILGRILAGERITHYETERVRKDGRRVSVWLTISPIRVDDEIVGASVIARDNTQRVQARKRADQLQEITSALAREAEPQRAIEVLVRGGAEALGADAAAVGLLDATLERVVLADHAGHSSESRGGRPADVRGDPRADPDLGQRPRAAERALLGARERVGQLRLARGAAADGRGPGARRRLLQLR